MGKAGSALTGLVVAHAHPFPGSAEAATPRRRNREPAFLHPGILHDRAELDFIRAKVTAGEEPWRSGWKVLREHRIAQLRWTPEPFPEVNRGPYNKPDIGSTELWSDSAAAYAHGTQWYVTEDEAHARKAIEILNAYASTLKSVIGHDARLLVGMAGISLVNAAELMRHTDTGWGEDDQDRFRRLLRDRFYVVIADFYPSANGNWDAAMIQTMLAMGVFLDDRAMFERAVDYYQHGPGNGAVQNYINEFGECQESGRDQAHTQMGLGYLGCACEIAWKQGVDLYGAYESRLALGFEYTARYNLGHDVRYEPYRSFEDRYYYPTISDKARGRFRPIYERVYHHYHDRKGMAMPFTRQVIDRIRPEGWDAAHAAWGTLMHASLPAGETYRELMPTRTVPDL